MTATTGSRVQGELPPQLDLRLRRALDDKLADEVVLALDHLAMAKSPRTNYRFTLTRDGALRYVQHSGAAGDWQVPFDRPLPGKPSAQVPAAKVASLLAQLEAAGFFALAPYQADPQVEDGWYVIVRARGPGGLHAVVFQNLQPPLFAELSALSDPLWKQPR